MKTYHQFITEVEALPHIGKSNKTGIGNSVGASHSAQVKRHGLKHLSTMKNGAEIWHKRYSDGQHSYHVKHPTEDHHSLVVVTKQHGASEDIKNAGGTDSNPTKLHHFYHHLITKHDKILTTKQQTGGSQKAWERMAKMHGVNIHGFHRGKGVNTDPKFKDRSDSHLSTQEYNKTYRSGERDVRKGVTKAKDFDTHVKGMNKIHGTKMVAHKK